MNFDRSARELLVGPLVAGSIFGLFVASATMAVHMDRAHEFPLTTHFGAPVGPWTNAVIVFAELAVGTTLLLGLLPLVIRWFAGRREPSTPG